MYSNRELAAFQAGWRLPGADVNGNTADVVVAHFALASMPAQSALMSAASCAHKFRSEGR
jgi:hypothetical protein